MRFLHIGDPHIRSGDHLDDAMNCLSFTAELARDQEVDVILIPGDVFETKSSPVEREAFRLCLGELRHNFSGPVLICKGNHDAPQDLLIWNLAEGVHIFERPILLTIGKDKLSGDAMVLIDSHVELAKREGDELVDVLIVPWPEKAHLAAMDLTGETGEQAGNAAIADMIRMMAATRSDPERPLVGMGHLSITGAVTSSGQPLIGREIQIAAHDLVETGASYWALGHIHKHQHMADRVVYAGSLTGHDHGETDEKGVVLVDVNPGDDVRIEWIPVPARRWVTVEAWFDELGCVCESIEDTDVTGITGEDLPDANVRFRYRCTEDQKHLFHHAEIERRFAAVHTLKIEPVIERADRIRSLEVAEAETVQDKLEAWGRATDTAIPATAVEKLNQLVDESRA